MGIEGSDLKAYKNTKRRIFTQENCYKYNQRCIVIRYLVLLVYWIGCVRQCTRGLVANLAILWRRGARTPQIPLCTRAKKEKKTISGGGGAGRPTLAGSGRVTRPRLRLRVAVVVVVVVSRNARVERRIPRTVSSSSSSSSPSSPLPPHKSALLSKRGGGGGGGGGSNPHLVVFFFFFAAFNQSLYLSSTAGRSGFRLFVSSSPSRAGVGIDPRPARPLAL